MILLIKHNTIMKQQLFSPFAIELKSGKVLWLFNDVMQSINIK